MCIVCEFITGPNEGNPNTVADNFLHEFNQSRKVMRQAADTMLLCSQLAPTTEGRRRYDRTHKKMVALIKQWNRIEEEREIDHPPFLDTRGNIDVC